MARLATFLALAASLMASPTWAQPTPIFSDGATGRSHGPGTGVKVSPDGSKLYVTADDGALVIADATTGVVSNTITPPGAVACNTGVSFTPDGSEVMYAVWTDASGTNSQINAYSTSDDGIAWSYDVPGQLAGAPVYGKNGDKVYFTWNDSEGHFTALDVLNGVVTEEFTQSLTDIDIGPPKGANKTLITSEMTWSGVDVVFDPIRVQEIEDDNGVGTGEYEEVPGGNYRFGVDNTNDMVVWAHIAKDGERTNTAYYYVYQAPTLPTNPYEVVALDDSGWAVFKRPVLAANGLRMAVAGQRGTARGWTQPSLLSQGANIRLNIKQNQRDGPNPSASTPSFTPDASRMFFASTLNAVYSVDATQATPPDDGSEEWVAYEWETVVDSTVLAATVASPDSAHVYAMTSGGFAHKLAVATGVDEWTNIRATGGVDADFDVNSAGNMFFVTTGGALSGWAVGGAVADPTDAPTTMPTMAPVEPTEAPTTSPTMMPVDPTDVPTTAPVEPTEVPTQAPIPEDATRPPTMEPVESTEMPTAMPVAENVTVPTMAPVPEGEVGTMEPTMSPDVMPQITVPPTDEPTDAPTSSPTFMPSPEPTLEPSSAAKMSAGLAMALGALALMML